MEPPKSAARVGRPPQVELSQLLEASLVIVDRDGVEALTMRRLARDLGISPMAAYRHVANKDELLRLAAGHVVHDIQPARDGADWAAVLQEFFEAVYDRLIRYPGMARLYGTDTFLSETVYAVAEPVFAALLAAGFTAEQAVSAFIACGSLVIGGALLGTGAPTDTSSSLTVSADCYPNVARVLQELSSRQTKARIIDGLEHTIRGYSDQLRVDMFR